MTMSRPPLSSSEEIGEVPDSAHWFEGLPWAASLRTEEAAFSLVDKQLTVQLSFDWAPPSNYLLRIQVVTKPLQSKAPTLPEPDHAEERQLSGANDEKEPRNIERKDEGSTGDIHATLEDARLDMLDSDGSARPAETLSGGEEGEASREPDGAKVDGEVEGEESVSA